MTSVKEFRVADAATENRLGAGRFVFTDAYSVFDWGKMPDQIPGKGASLCLMGAANFERLEAAGIPTHYRGVETDTGIAPLESAGSPPTEMAIDLAQVPELPYAGSTYDYDTYHGATGDNYLIPLEIVFRNSVPIGSSLRRRRSPGDVGLDEDEWPESRVDLPEPVIEFSTKYEQQDRYLDRKTAARVAGAADLEVLTDLAREVNRVVSEAATEAGFSHEDGKIECLYHDRTVKVADVVGTFDENRFGYDGQEVSKEVLRQHYKREHSEWVNAVADAKRQIEHRDTADWRPLCDITPMSLSPDAIEIAADLYTAGANTYTNRDWFDAPSIDNAVEATQQL